MRFSSPIKLPWPLGLLMASLVCPLGFAGEGGKSGSDRIFTEFVTWFEDYLAAEENARSAMISEGKQLAQKRRFHLSRLIEKAPKEAVKAMLSAEQWEGLPAPIREHTERPIKGEGTLEVIIQDDFERGLARYDYYFSFEGHRFRAYLGVDEPHAPLNRPLRIEGFLLRGRVVLTDLQPAL